MSSRVRVGLVGTASVLLVLLLVFLATPYVAQWLYVYPDREAARVMKLARHMELSRVQKVVLHVEQPKDGMNPTTVVLTSHTDRVDMERLLLAMRTSEVGEHAVRIGAPCDVIKVYVRDGPDFALWGRFDPALAPIVSGRLRSNDLSRIVQDIVKRKGKRHVPTH